MPLSKNVYGITQTELYRNVDREADPKAILNGVAVSGLVGVLRQLGDLAESAAEIFHGLQEEVMATASRSNQLKIRLQHIEATVPPLEKAMLAQRTHIHFAYTGGLEWHPRISNEQNHLIYNDLPQFIMDPYEDCRDPPRLHLLDKFDINGPGSCLKRYSDPTYFRRASSNLIHGNKKFQKDKKHCKNKKKKSSSRSRDMSRLASMANQSARKTLTAFSFSGQTSSSKTTSTSDMEKIFDFQDHHSRSFESRSGSGYVECLSTATSSLKTGEKPKGVVVSSSLTPGSGSCTIASVLSECETEAAHDDFRLSPSQGQAARGSSCVSWDEKVEIVESLGVQTDKASEMMEMKSVVNARNEIASYGEGTGRVTFHSKDIKADKSESGLQKHIGIDEVREIKTGQDNVRELGDIEQETESEGDCFVDALNTIETESGSNQGPQTSQEVVSGPFGVRDDGLEKPVCEQEIEQNSNSVRDSCGTDALMHYDFKNEENASIANAFYEMNHEDPQAGSDVNLRNDLCSSNNMPKKSNREHSITFTFVPALESSLSNSSNLSYHPGLQETREPEAVISGDLEAIKIWTNGGLLGLKPSKPPVVAVPSSLSPDFKTAERIVGSTEAEKDKSEDLVENASHRHVMNNSSLATPGSQNPISSDRKTMSFVGQRECNEVSSGVFGLSHKLLTNSFRRNDSLSHDRKIMPPTIPENDKVTTEKSRFCNQNINEKTLIDPFRDEAPFQWTTSSPPLQHMKISLNPSDTLQASRLRLKFSDADPNYTSFSSFQLLPEAATSIPDYYSDDDTFCRSSYMSDTDHLSDNYSLSNSEQWEESSDSHERKEQELYNSFHESRYVDNNAETSLPGMKLERGSVAVNLSYLQNPADPLPPPFPPVQWMVSRTASENVEKKTQSLQLQDALRFAFEKHLSLSTVDKELPNMVASVPIPETKVHLKNNVREEKQSANAKEIETGDFLQQIRTQQINLRPVVMTTTSSATPTTDPIINTKISAILEKANSIRQAVASKDGDESDTWSDT